MSVSTLGQEPLPQRLEHEQSQSHDHEIHDRGQYEYQVPAAGRRFDQIGNRNQERRRTFSRVEQTEVDGRKLGSKGIRAR